MIDIYLGLPYMHDSPTMMDIRADVSDLVAVDLANKRKSVYAPISSWHRISIKYGMRGDWEFWQHFDRSFIKCCNEVHFITLPGYLDSTGVNAEKKIAIEFEKDIFYIDPAEYLFQLSEIYTDDDNMSNREKALRLKFIEFMVESVGKRKLATM